MIWESVLYVTSAFMFWQSIMMTCAIGVIIGMALHNGDVKGASKTLITALPLIVLTSMVSYFRVAPHVVSDIITEKTYAGTITSLFVGLSYINGYLFGVCLLRGQNHHKRHD